MSDKNKEVRFKQIMKSFNKEKRRKNKSELEEKLPDEWKSPPKYLKGYELVDWNDKRKALLKKINRANKQAAIQEKNNEKKTKKAEKKVKSNRISTGEDTYMVGFDSKKEEIIENYLKTMSTNKPTFLIPLNKYHATLQSNDKNVFEGGSRTEISKTIDLEEEMDFDSAFKMVHSLSENIDCNFNEHAMGLDKIKNFFNVKENLPTSIEYLNDYDAGNCESLDKYKHLENTQFKQEYLQTLSQKVENNRNKAIKKHGKGMHRIPTQDEDFFTKLIAKRNNLRYQNMQRFRAKLPAFKMQDEILRLVHENQVILISGETGCGKTTQVAQFILDNEISKKNGSMCSILCTQPRRISAISVSQRVADERAESVGKESVGYQIRLERRVGRVRGSLLFVTTGILLQYLQSDPTLKSYSHIIIDEIHERDILCDFALAVLKDIIAIRKDLKIILMSATLNADQFSKYFYNCPTLNIPGYTYPVQEFFLEDVLQLTRFKFKPSRKESDDKVFKQFVIPYANSLQGYTQSVIEGLRHPESEKVNPPLIAELVKYICRSSADGAILIFAPGWEDINSIIKEITKNQVDYFNPSKFKVIPLHSMLPNSNQKEVFDRPPKGVRKIIVATNIAETSITIDDVVFVIDSGKTKIKNYDVANNISTLKSEFVSLANARQRKGRAGRVQGGYCYHLFSRGRFNTLENYPLPEIVRSRLEEVILSIKILLLGKAEPFLKKVMNPPNPNAVSTSIELLTQMNALDEHENLTPLGFHLAKLPIDPQLGKMLLIGVIMSCLNPILSIAATLAYKDPFYLPMGEEIQMKERKLNLDDGNKSDHILMARVLQEWEDHEAKRNGLLYCKSNFLTRMTLQQLRTQKEQFAQYLFDMGFINSRDFKTPYFNVNSNNKELIKAVLCCGLYPNLAIIKKIIHTNNKQILLLKTIEDGKVSLHPKSVNAIQTTEFSSHFLMYHEKLKSTVINIFDTTMVSALPVVIFSSDFYLSYKSNQTAIIHINGDLKFTCSKKTAQLITEIRLRFNWLLEYKLSHPGNLMWKDNSPEIELLKILTDLLTNDKDFVMDRCDSSGNE